MTTSKCVADPPDGGSSRDDLEKRKLEAEIAKLRAETEVQRRETAWFVRGVKLVAPVITVGIAAAAFLHAWSSSRADRADRDFQSAVALAADSPALAAAALVVHGPRAVPIIVAIAAGFQASEEWPTSALIALDSLKRIGAVSSGEHERQLTLACHRAVGKALAVDLQIVEAGRADVTKLRADLGEIFLFLDALEQTLECPLWRKARTDFESNYPDLL